MPTLTNAKTPALLEPSLNKPGTLAQPAIKGPGSRLSMAEAAAAIAAAHGLTVRQLRSHTRAHDISHPRQDAMALMRAQTRPCGRPRYSCLQIARYFGLKNHSTCVHALKAAAHRRNQAAAR